MSRRRLIHAAVLTGLLAVLPACGGGSGSGATGTDGEAAAGKHPRAKASTGDVAGGPGLTVTAGDLYFKPAEVTVPAGDVHINFVNKGQLEHTLLVDGVRPFRLLVTKKGDEDSGSVTLEPGKYTFYCDIPGHRAAGMESRLIVQ